MPGVGTLQQEDLLPLATSGAVGCTESPCPFVKAGTKRRTGFEKYRGAALIASEGPRLADYVKIYQDQ